MEKLQNLEKCIFCCFAGGPQRYQTLSVLIPNPGKIAKPGNACFAGFREGPNAIQRYPSLSQTLEKLQNLEKCIFCWFAGGAKTWKNYKTWKNVFFASLRDGPNAIQRYPSLSQTLKKLQNLEKCIFCWFPGRVQRYPTLSVLISDPRKIAKPGKKIFLLFCGRSQNLEKLQKLENAFFAGFREGFNAIQKHFFLLCGKASTLSNAIRPYPKPWKNCKTWKNAFFAGFREGPNAIRPYPRP